MSKLGDIVKKGTEKAYSTGKVLAVEVLAETAAETIVKGGTERMAQRQGGQGKNNTGSQKNESLTALFVKLVMERWKKSGSEYRDEMWAFVLTDLKNKDEKASKNLALRLSHREKNALKPYGNHDKKDEDKVYYQDGDEQHMIGVLGSIYRHLDDTPEEHEIRANLFLVLGRMNHKKFDTTLEAFHDDRILQWVRKGFSIVEAVSGQIKKVAPEIYKDLEKLAEKAASRALDGLLIADKFIGEELNKLESHLNKQWWVMQPEEKSVTKKIIDKIFGGR